MDYDVIIIGSGAGGAATAYKLAKAGVRTLLIERGPVLPMDDTTLDVDKVVIRACFQYSEIWHDRGGRQFFPERIREPRRQDKMVRGGSIAAVGA